MTTELKERNNYRTAKTCVRAVANHFEKHRSWIRCPRCIGGNMYLDTNGEFVFHCYPDCHYL
ncbi:MAG: hypothetical protein ACLPVI_07990 [Dehalococcoidales bacterium]